MIEKELAIVIADRWIKEGYKPTEFAQARFEAFLKAVENLSLEIGEIRTAEMLSTMGEIYGYAS
jgi:hypothetical protein